ncbi:amidase domain-containing protein [Candidatus Enterococcus ikei]|uniref:Amidase domain-containing protein n=1 Tax=Candidatus Enterococcus ikei TaxID=2815326 RepID=A0ABS3H173_9ENTE|nr:amidase domain-containing protein [Enterococcus sp. DIV0869a]MBO0441267.1 amidase domain-containing protein [Enterococcus sp. DIV0869a]
MKKILFTILLVGIMLSYNWNEANAEDGQSISETIQQLEIQKKKGTRSNVNSYMMKTIAETEESLINELSSHSIVVDPTNLEYLDILNKIISEEIILDFSNKEEIYEYISVYQARIAPYQADQTTNTESYNLFVNNRTELLQRTFESIKQENMMQLLEADKINSQKNRSRAAVFNRKKPNLSAMNSYAKKFAMGYNSMQYPKYTNGDCTNFASQILERSGLMSVNKRNDSGQVWYCDGNFNTTVAWRLAHSWALYWTAEGYPTRTFGDRQTNQVNSYAKAGDFLAYFTRGTYQINHITYVNRKDGNGNIRVSQHSGARYDDTWKNINVWSNYNQIISIRFT